MAVNRSTDSKSITTSGATFSTSGSTFSTSGSSEVRDKIALIKAITGLTTTGQDEIPDPAKIEQVLQKEGAPKQITATVPKLIQAASKPTTPAEQAKLDEGQTKLLTQAPASAVKAVHTLMTKQKAKQRARPQQLGPSGSGPSGPVIPPTPRSPSASPTKDSEGMVDFRQRVGSILSAVAPLGLNLLNEFLTFSPQTITNPQLKFTPSGQFADPAVRSLSQGLNATKESRLRRELEAFDKAYPKELERLTQLHLSTVPDIDVIQRHDLPRYEYLSGLANQQASRILNSRLKYLITSINQNHSGGV